MGWWPFGRSGGGRHALGAAVTSIPSGPLVLPAEVRPAPAVAAAPVAVLPVGVLPVEVLSVEAPPAEVLPVAVLPDERDGGPRQQLETLLAMLGAGEVPAEALGQPAPVPDPGLAVTGGPPAEEPREPVEAAAPLPPAALAEPTPSHTAEADLAAETPFVVVPVQAPPPFVPPGPPALAPELLAAVAEPRVELGFRDGSTTSLQPGSEQARALEDLARLLTSR